MNPRTVEFAALEVLYDWHHVSVPAVDPRAVPLWSELSDAQLAARVDRADVFVEVIQRNADNVPMLVSINADGREVVEQGRQRRNSGTARAAACMAQLLRWAYSLALPELSYPTLGDFMDSSASTYYGSTFTTAEIDRAVGRLIKAGLVEGPPSSQDLFGEVTAAGRRCLRKYDGDVQAWQDAQDEAGGQSTVFHIGSVQGPVVNAGRDAHHITQSMTVGPDVNDVAKWLNAVRQALPAAELADDHAVRVEDALQQLDAQVSAGSPQPSRLRELGNAAVLAVAEAQAVAGSEYMLGLLADAGRALFGG